MSLFGRKRRTYNLSSDDIGVTLQDRAFVAAVAVETLRSDPAWSQASDAERRTFAKRALSTRYLVRTGRLNEGDKP
jgi:hypothetical protein